MTPMIKISYWCHNPYEAIPVIAKLKQVVMPYIELIQYKNTPHNLPSRFKGYAFMNPHLLSEHNYQIILDKLKEEKILTTMNMWKIKITTM